MRDINKKRTELRVLTIIGIVAGFFVITAFNAQHPEVGISNMLSSKSVDQYFEGKSLEKIDEYVKEMKVLEENRDSLLEEIKGLEGTISEYEEIAAQVTHRGDEIKEELQRSRMIAGTLDTEGPGVEITLDDRKRDTILDKDSGKLSFYIVHDSDLLEVVNELRAAGAEAVAINGVRIIGSSRISCGGPTINVGKEQRFVPPFVIEAIGDPDTLYSYMKREDSISHTLLFWGLGFSLKKKDSIQIPRFIGDVEYKYAKPVEEG